MINWMYEEDSKIPKPEDCRRTKLYAGEKLEAMKQKLQAFRECDNPECGCHFYEVDRIKIREGHDLVTYAHPIRENIVTDEYY